MLTDIAFTNFRSLRSVQLQLKPITLVIGPNASGKSNLFKALRFLHDAVAGDLRDWQSYDSLIDDLVWFGTDDRGERPEEIETTLGFQHLPAVQPLTYKAVFRAERYLEILDERLIPGNIATGIGSDLWLERKGQQILRHIGVRGNRLTNPRKEKARSGRNLTLRDEGPSPAYEVLALRALGLPTTPRDRSGDLIRRSVVVSSPGP